MHKLADCLFMIAVLGASLFSYWLKWDGLGTTFTILFWLCLLSVQGNEWEADYK